MRRSSSSPPSGQGESEAAQIAQLRQGVIDTIKQLKPPSDTNLDAFLKAMSDEVSAGQKIGLAVQRGEDPSQFETQLDSAKSAAEQAGSAYGFKQCGAAISSSSTSSSSSSSSSQLQLELEQRRHRQPQSPPAPPLRRRHQRRRHRGGGTSGSSADERLERRRRPAPDGSAARLGGGIGPG